MAPNKFVVLTGALVLGAAAALVLGRSEKKADPRLGQPLLTAADMAAVDMVQIKKAGSDLAMKRDADGVWHLKDEQGFPVDATKIVRLLDDLGRATFQMVASTNKDQFSEFGLSAPTSLSLSAPGKDVLTLSLGDSRKGGGQYVAVGGEYKVYLIGQPLATSPDAEAWELKTLLSLSKDEVKSVAFVPAAGLAKKPLTLGREKPTDKLVAVGPTAPEKADASAAPAEGLFSSVTFTKRYDANNEEAKAALQAPSRVMVTLFDGRSYEFVIGSVGDKNKKYFLKIHAQKNAAALDAQAQKQMDGLNALMQSQAFEVPAYAAERWEKGG